MVGISSFVAFLNWYFMRKVSFCSSLYGNSFCAFQFTHYSLLRLFSIIPTKLLRPVIPTPPLHPSFPTKSVLPSFPTERSVDRESPNSETALIDIPKSRRKDGRGSTEGITPSRMGIFTPQKAP